KCNITTGQARGHLMLMQHALERKRVESFGQQVPPAEARAVLATPRKEVKPFEFNILSPKGERTTESDAAPGIEGFYLKLSDILSRGLRSDHHFSAYYYHLASLMEGLPGKEPILAWLEDLCLTGGKKKQLPNAERYQLLLGFLSRLITVLKQRQDSVPAAEAYARVGAAETKTLLTQRQFADLKGRFGDFLAKQYPLRNLVSINLTSVNEKLEGNNGFTVKNENSSCQIAISLKQRVDLRALFNTIHEVLFNGAHVGHYEFDSQVYKAWERLAKECSCLPQALHVATGLKMRTILRHIGNKGEFIDGWWYGDLYKIIEGFIRHKPRGVSGVYWNAQNKQVMIRCKNADILISRVRKNVWHAEVVERLSLAQGWKLIIAPQDELKGQLAGYKLPGFCQGEQAHAFARWRNKLPDPARVKTITRKGPDLILPGGASISPADILVPRTPRDRKLTVEQFLELSLCHPYNRYIIVPDYPRMAFCHDIASRWIMHHARGALALQKATGLTNEIIKIMEGLDNINPLGLDFPLDDVEWISFLDDYGWWAIHEKNTIRESIMNSLREFLGHPPTYYYTHTSSLIAPRGFPLERVISPRLNFDISRFLKQGMNKAEAVALGCFLTAGRFSQDLFQRMGLDATPLLIMDQGIGMEGHMAFVHNMKVLGYVDPRSAEPFLKALQQAGVDGDKINGI
ncbi:MAG: hypothetical protein NT033_09720, partial [Candidatus Omnitrophica bacterium]|nr:hypothetical protein [Candidatus Omnitrophota bacterium]